ncbi:MAG: phage minor capsid protein, partial [Christensenellales bacterium]
MANLTPEEILRISEPVEQIYSNVVDALLVNLAKHLKGGQALSTEQWEIQKLSELGKLSEESIEIISQLTGMTQEQVKQAIESAALIATDDVEKALKAGEKAGKISAPTGESVLASENVVQAINALQ